MIKINKKLLMSILLSGSIALSTYGCTKDIKEKHDSEKPLEIFSIEVNNTPSVEKQVVYVDKRNATIDLNTINTNYVKCEEDNHYTLYTGQSIYYKFDWNITDEEITDRLISVVVIAKNDEFAKVQLPTGEIAYVHNYSLIKNANINNEAQIHYIDSDSRLMCSAYMYDVKTGMYMGYLNEGELCHVIASNGEYSMIKLSDGTTGWILDIVIDKGYVQVDGVAFVKVGTPVYSDKELTNLYYTSDDDMLYVEYMTNSYAAVFNRGGKDLLYVNPSSLDDDFILVDLNQQRMECYLDYKLAGSWGTRTGKDETPTCTGAFDIDAKVADWEFTTFPGSYAKHWIPISTETQQGIHDLVGDDESSYGSELYHTYGSHGCIRVPREASQFVYDNYNVGDMVLVRKK